MTAVPQEILYVCPVCIYLCQLMTMSCSPVLYFYIVLGRCPRTCVHVLPVSGRQDLGVCLHTVRQSHHTSACLWSGSDPMQMSQAMVGMCLWPCFEHTLLRGGMTCCCIVFNEALNYEHPGLYPDIWTKTMSLFRTGFQSCIQPRVIIQPFS